jgi:hypothetical protein
MKHFILLLGLGLNVAAAHAAQNQKSTNPIEVSAEIEKIFIPQGFDDNDTVESSFTGNSPTPATKWATQKPKWMLRPAR